MKHYFTPVLAGHITTLESIGQFKNLKAAKEHCEKERGHVPKLIGTNDQQVATVRHFRERVAKMNGVKLVRRRVHASEEAIERLSAEERYILKKLMKIQKLTHYIMLDL